MTVLLALDEQQPVFPDTSQALTDPDGLLALGGNLSTEVLVDAYSRGIFPWFDDEQPILWWCPSRRSVILPGGLHISRSLRKALRRTDFSITTDQAFDDVIRQCAAPRQLANTEDGELSGSWITEDMFDAYCELHRAGHAHSVEVWQNNKLVGGLYGVATGAVFCGESMFSRADNASKIALVALSEALFSQGFKLIDCQIDNPHLTSLGAVEIPRSEFLQYLNSHTNPLPWPELNMAQLEK